MEYMKLKIIHTLVILGVYLSTGNGYKILGVIPGIARSHWIAISPLLKELAHRGHEVTAISTFPMNEPVSNYSDIRINLNMGNVLDTANNTRTFLTSGVSLWKLTSLTTSLGEKAVKVLNTPAVQKLINERNEHFDVVIYELFFTESLLGFTHKFKAPAILFCPFVGAEFVGDAVGNPNPYSYVPNPFFDFSDKMSFIERLINTIVNVFTKLMYHWINLPRQDVILREYFGGSGDIPHVSDLYHNISLVLVNSHESVSYPKPLVPNLVYVGGLHISPPKKLPADLQSFLDSAQDGVVYFSLGSHILSADLPPEILDALLDTFLGLKQKVLWKFENDTLPRQPKNLKIGKWLPQNDILAHPNVRVFITHGGLLSTQEATYHGVPVIGIPVMGDQQLNMAQTERLGCGVTLKLSNISVESLTWALNEVLYDERYRENARYRSNIFRDRQHTPLQTAVYWTEYIIRHKGAPHMRSAALDLHWYQYYLLDVIIFIASILSVIPISLMIIFKNIKKIFKSKKD